LFYLLFAHQEMLSRENTAWELEKGCSGGQCSFLIIGIGMPDVPTQKI
jgi:hypothetical protein